MKRLAAVLAALSLGLAVPAAAVAQFGPSNVPAPLTQPSPSDQVVKPTDDNGGLSTFQLVLMFGGAIVVIAAIGWFITRDARRVAPVADRSRVSDASAGQRKSTREREREQARKRAKAKAARDQRKRNRPR